MIKITITVTPEEFEVSNMLLARAIEQVQEKEALRKCFGMTEGDVGRVISFRSKLLDSFLERSAPAPAPGEGV
jgi:hypothetical protein